MPARRFVFTPALFPLILPAIMSVPAADAAPLVASAALPSSAAVPVGTGVPDLGASLLAVVVMVAALAALPWLLRRWQQRVLMQGRGAQRHHVQVLSTAMIGPQQRVVVVDVAAHGPGASSACLVLGVTAGSITCLHVLPGADAPNPVAKPCCGTTGAAAVLPTGSVAALQQHCDTTSTVPGATPDACAPSTRLHAR